MAHAPTAAMDVRQFLNGKLLPGAADDFFTQQDNKEKREANATPSLEAIVSSMPFVVISIGNCPQCEELAAMLSSKGVPDTVLVKWDKAAHEYQDLKRQLSAHAGDVFTFPQVFAGGAYQGGYKDAVDKVERGVFDELFEKEFDIDPHTLHRMIGKRSMIAFSLPNCPQCDTLYEDLKRRGVPVQDVFVKLDKARPEYQALKAQMQRLIGKQQFAFPQTFVRGVYQGDFDEVIARADKGEYEDLFSQEFGIAPKVVQDVPSPGAIAFDDDF